MPRMMHLRPESGRCKIAMVFATLILSSDTGLELVLALACEIFEVIVFLDESDRSIIKER